MSNYQFYKTNAGGLAIGKEGTDQVWGIRVARAVECNDTLPKLVKEYEGMLVDDPRETLKTVEWIESQGYDIVPVTEDQATSFMELRDTPHGKENFEFFTDGDGDICIRRKDTNKCIRYLLKNVKGNTPYNNVCMLINLLQEKVVEYKDVPDSLTFMATSLEDFDDLVSELTPMEFDTLSAMLESGTDSNTVH